MKASERLRKKERERIVPTTLSGFAFLGSASLSITLCLRCRHSDHTYSYLLLVQHCEKFKCTTATFSLASLCVYMPMTNLPTARANSRRT